MKPAHETVARLLADAEARERAGDTDGAVGFYDRAATLEPENADVWRGKALALASAQRYAESLAVLSHGVKVAPDDDRMAGLYITNLRELGHTEDAFASAQAALRRAPHSIWVLKAAGDTWRDRDDYAQALRLYERGLALAPDDTMLLRARAKALAMMER